MTPQEPTTPQEPEEQKKPEAVTPPPETPTDPSVSATLRATSDSAANRVKPILATTQERSPEEVDKMFKDPNRVFVVVEDDPEASDDIVEKLNKKRGEEESENVKLAECLSEAEQAIDQILQKPNVANITLILDMNFPEVKGGISFGRPGIKVLDYANEKIKAHNATNPEKQIHLEVIMNSSTISNQEDTEKLGAQRFSRDKFKVVNVIEDHFGNKPLPPLPPKRAPRRIEEDDE